MADMAAIDAKRLISAQQIAGQVIREAPDGRIAIAILGITAAGKSSFADALAEAIHARGRAVLRATIDDFHHPITRRMREDMSSALAYYHHAHDLDALKERLLDPFEAGALAVQTASLDLATDQPVNPAPVTVSPDCVLVIDGTFLLKPALRDYWKSSIWLDTPFDIAAERGARRDAAMLGGLDQAQQRYATRYHAACKHYMSECAPQTAASWVVA